ncbi:MAG: GNAT family N-acetyltransferase [Ferruginibacter sp.]|nr:GNAT family N-acetyltransferase [Ferruginibacter sp.]
MIRAKKSDKSLIIDILSASFENNNSVNYTIKQDEKRALRIRRLMEYSFDVCFLFGNIYLSNDKRACALTLLPDQKKTTLKAILLDAQLALSVIGLTRIKKVLNRESIIKSGYPDEPVYYLWFLGVDPTYQNKGIGSTLFKDLIQESRVMKRPLYLETSMTQNIPFYERFGCQVYNKHEFKSDLYSHTLYCIRKPVTN